MYKRKGLGIFLIVLGSLCFEYFFSALMEYTQAIIFNPQMASMRAGATISLVAGIVFLPTGIGRVKNIEIHNKRIHNQIMCARRAKLQESVFDEGIFAEKFIQATLEKQMTEKEGDYHV